MSKYSVMGYEPALVLVATLMAIMAVSVVAVPAAHHLHHHSGGHHRMMSSGGAAGSSSPSLSGIDHPLSKRSFFDIQCKGVYDKTIFARLDRVCEDCYNLFREPQLHSLCRFASPSHLTHPTHTSACDPSPTPLARSNNRYLLRICSQSKSATPFTRRRVRTFFKSGFFFHYENWFAIFSRNKPNIVMLLWNFAIALTLCNTYLQLA